MKNEEVVLLYAAARQARRAARLDCKPSMSQGTRRLSQSRGIRVVTSRGPRDEFPAVV